MRSCIVLKDANAEKFVANGHYSFIILGTKKTATTRIYIIYIKNHLYYLPEQAKPHQGGGKTEAVPSPPDAARPNGQTTKRRKKEQ